MKQFSNIKFRTQTTKSPVTKKPREVPKTTLNLLREKLKSILNKLFEIRSLYGVGWLLYLRLPPGTESVVGADNINNIVELCSEDDLSLFNARLATFHKTVSIGKKSVDEYFGETGRPIAGLINYQLDDDSCDNNDDRSDIESPDARAKKKTIHTTKIDGNTKINHIPKDTANFKKKLSIALTRLFKIRSSRRIKFMLVISPPNLSDVQTDQTYLEGSCVLTEFCSEATSSELRKYLWDEHGSNAKVYSLNRAYIAQCFELTKFSHKTEANW